MTSIALGIFIIFIIYIMIWSIKNDDVSSIGEQTGFIRMRNPSNTAAKSTRQPNHRRPQTTGSRRSERMNRRHEPYS
jgi:hypothetical protein